MEAKRQPWSRGNLKGYSVNAQPRHVVWAVLNEPTSWREPDVLMVEIDDAIEASMGDDW